MSALLSVWVPGTPRPKGSVTVNGDGRTVRPAQRESGAWQRCVALHVRRSVDGTAPYVGPVSFSGVFAFRPPERGEAGAYPMGRAYDGDKLQRCVADALSACGSRGSAGCKPGCRKHGGLLSDDDRIVAWGPFYVVWADHEPGAHLMVAAL